MSKPNASGKAQPAERPGDREPADAQAESLTDLIDVLQRESFIRRFEPRTQACVVERAFPTPGSPTLTPGRGRSS